MLLKLGGGGGGGVCHGKSGPAGLILVAKSGPPGPYLSAKSGLTLPKTVRYSFNEFVLNKTRKACPSIFFFQRKMHVSGLIAGVIGYTVRPNFRSGGPYSLREYGPPRTQLPREYGPPDRVPWLYKTN